MLRSVLPSSRLWSTGRRVVSLVWVGRRFGLQLWKQQVIELQDEVNGDQNPLQKRENQLHKPQNEHIEHQGEFPDEHQDKLDKDQTTRNHSSCAKAGEASDQDSAGRCGDLEVRPRRRPSPSRDHSSTPPPVCLVRERPAMPWRQRTGLQLQVVRVPAAPQDPTPFGEVPGRIVVIRALTRINPPQRGTKGQP